MTAPFLPTAQPRLLTEPAAALAALRDIYDANTTYLRQAFEAYTGGQVPAGRTSACYPYVAFTTTLQTQVDTRLAYGFVPGPGRYHATLTRPDLYADYYLEQFARLLANHPGVALEIGVSAEPIPVHFAYPQGLHVEAALTTEGYRNLQDYFDVPNLASMDDAIANGEVDLRPGDNHPLALFSAARVDYSLHRLRHYTATAPDQFQNYIIFTNYQFYVDEFVRHAASLMRQEGPQGAHSYTGFVQPGDHRLALGGTESGTPAARLPQMPAYHLQRADKRGITIVNIGVGPSNAKTITDHLAVLRPHAWIMVGHCAGLRATQRLGDYVLAHAYVREDHVLDADLPVWVPIPALAEIQSALEEAVGQVSGLSGYDVKSIMRTGTVVTLDNRNWELRQYGELQARFGQSRAIAVDMESATIAANGYRFRVPYGTLLCVSDKPMHGEVKLPGMADQFYRQRVDQHLQVGVAAMEKLAALPLDQLHSRKLRSFFETAFQ